MTILRPVVRRCIHTLLTPMGSRISLMLMTFQVQELRMGIYFLDKMQQFKMSVPMMAKLQTPSLRQRHWNVLIDKTGRNFNVASMELHLSHLFAMELYKYQVGILRTRSPREIIHRFMYLMDNK